MAPSALTGRSTLGAAAALAALMVLTTGCDRSGPRAVVPAAGAPLPAPAAPSTWPPPPSLPRRSCWARDTGAGPLVPAPQELPDPPATAPEPHAVLAELGREFGDRSLIRRASLGRPPAQTRRHVRGYLAGRLPPGDGVWLYVSAPAAAGRAAKPTPAELRRMMLAEWEVALFAAGLRDRLCAARSAPLVGWSNIAGGAFVVSDHVFPFGLRFPTPDRGRFRSALARAAARYEGEVVSLRYVHGLQAAPIVVLRARDRERFAANAAKLMTELDPRTGAAATWEGFFLETVDDDGPFLRFSRVMRGQVFGAQWAWDLCRLPYEHTQQVGAPRCPDD